MRILNKLYFAIIFFHTFSMAANAENAVIGVEEDFQPLNNGTGFVLQKMYIPQKGFAKGKFIWNATRNSWDLSGPLIMETPSLYARIELWKHYADNTTPVAESLTIWAGGVGVTGVSFVSPKGITYNNCTLDGSFQGLAEFNCDIGNLPIGQSEFTSGKYVINYTVSGSPTPVQRNYYVNGTYPSSFSITYPQNGSTNIPKSFTAKWQVVNAGEYDIGVKDFNTGNYIYTQRIFNSIATSLSVSIPAGILSPNTKYIFKIEALAPTVNGGHKGIKKSVIFTTGN